MHTTLDVAYPGELTPSPTRLHRQHSTAIADGNGICSFVSWIGSGMKEDAVRALRSPFRTDHLAVRCAIGCSIVGSGCGLRRTENATRAVKEEYHIRSANHRQLICSRGQDEANICTYLNSLFAEVEDLNDGTPPFLFLSRVVTRAWALTGRRDRRENRWRG